MLLFSWLHSEIRLLMLTVCLEQLSLSTSRCQVVQTLRITVFSVLALFHLWILPLYTETNETLWFKDPGLTRPSSRPWPRLPMRALSAHSPVTMMARNAMKTQVTRRSLLPRSPCPRCTILRTTSCKQHTQGALALAASSRVLPGAHSLAAPLSYSRALTPYA